MSAESFVVGLGFLPNANFAAMSDSITVLPASIPAAIEAAGAAEEHKNVETDDEEEDKLTF